MPRLSRSELDALKARISLIDLAQLLGIKVQHQRAKCLNSGAHSHGDRTPSMHLSAEMGRFKCWVCPEVKGDHFDLIMQSLSCSFPQAVEWLQKAVGAVPGSVPQIQRQDKPILSAAKPVEELWDRSAVLEDFWNLLEEPTGECELYLRKRKIFKAAWQGCKVRMIPHAETFGDRLLERHPLENLQKAGLFSEKGYFRFWNHSLLFPYFKSGSLNWFQTRSIRPGVQPKELNLSGSCPAPFHSKVLNGRLGKVFVCEGVIDSLTLIQSGFDAIAIPGAGSFKKEWLSLFENKTVFLELDADMAGQQASERLYQLMTDHGIRVFWQKIEPNQAGLQDHKYHSVQDFKKPLLNWGEDLNDVFRRH